MAVITTQNHGETRSVCLLVVLGSCKNRENIYLSKTIRKMYTIQPIQRMSRSFGRLEKPEKETIHSGQFMVSDFEAEEQDDEENVAVPIPETTDTKSIVALVPVRSRDTFNHEENRIKQQPPPTIDTSLSKLFQCMSLAYK